MVAQFSCHHRQDSPYESHLHDGALERLHPGHHLTLGDYASSRRSLNAEPVL